MDHATLSWRERWSFRSITLLLVALGLLTLLPAASPPGLKVLDLERDAATSGWRIRWEAVPGAEYLLQRVAGDQLPLKGKGTWLNVTSVTATGQVASAVDPVGPLVRQRFYRVLQINPVLRIIDIVRVGPDATFRIRWNSVPGNEYQLQKPLQDSLPGMGAVDWVPLTNVQATGYVSVVEDEVPPGVGQRFYRVSLISTLTNDVTPPWVQFEEALMVSNPDGTAGMELVFTVNDDSGVTGVTLWEGTNELGQAVMRPDFKWALTIAADLGSVQPRYFTAKARDLGGNFGESDPVGLMSPYPDLLAPLSDAGQAREGHALLMVDSNRVGSLIFRPGGRPRPGLALDFYLRFPLGATVHQSNDQVYLEFTQVSAGFDPYSPFQLVRPLERNSGSLQRLAVGPLPYDELMRVFGLSPTNSISLLVFKKFALQWRQGILDDRGLRGAQFKSDMRNLPLPEWSVADSQNLIDFTRERTVRIPFTGLFGLEDESDIPAQLHIPEARPFWLTLSGDGGLRLAGPVEFSWSNQVSLRAQLRLEDPQYHLALSSVGLRYAGLTNLAPFLPTDPSNCVRFLANPSNALRAPVCLGNLERSYTHFAAALSELSSNTPPSYWPMPGHMNPGADVIEAWAYGARARPLSMPGLRRIRPLLVRAGLQAAGAPELLEVLQIRMALLRTRAALVEGATAGGSNVLADLDYALAQAEAAAEDRMIIAETISLGSMAEVAGLLAQSDQLRQDAGGEWNQALGEIMATYLQTVADELAIEWGVARGVFTPDNNAIIQGLDRFRAMEMLKQMVAFRHDTESLAIPLSETLWPEFTGQLAEQLIAGLHQAIDSAVSASELSAFLETVRDGLDLVDWVRAGRIPVTPGMEDLASGVWPGRWSDQLDELLRADMNRLPAAQSLGRWASDLRVLMSVVKRLPGSGGWSLQAMQRIHDQVETSLHARPIEDVDAIRPLMEWLEAGLLQQQLAGFLKITSPINWPNDRLPRIVERLREVTEARRGWRETDTMVSLLLEAALEAGPTNVLGQVYLLKTAELVGAASQIARAMVVESAPVLRETDFSLPQDMAIDDPTGYLYYDRLARYWRGAVRGRLRIPSLGLDLTIPNASLESGGYFDLAAFGKLTFDGGRLVIPDRRPIHLKHSPTQGFSVAGDAQLNLTNGLRFESSLSLVDPVYQFSLAARGIQFDLGKQLVLQRPVLDPAALGQFNEEAQNGFAHYWRNLQGSMETVLASLTNYPSIDPNGWGRPPEFEAPEITLSFSGLNAWSEEVLARVNAGLVSGWEVKIEPVIEALHRLNQDAVSAQQTVLYEQGYVAILDREFRLRARMAEALNALGSDPNMAEVEALLKEGAMELARQVADRAQLGVPDDPAQALDLANLLVRAQLILDEFDVLEPPGELSADPCETAVSPDVNTHQRLEAVMACVARRESLKLGLNPDSGSVTDTNLFYALTSDELDFYMELFFEMERLLQKTGASRQSVFPTLQQILYRHLIVAGEEAEQTQNLSRRFLLALQLLDNQSVSQQSSLGSSEENMLRVLNLTVELLREPMEQAGDDFRKQAKVAQAIQAVEETRSVDRWHRQRRVESALDADRPMQLIDPTGQYQPNILAELAAYIRLLKDVGFSPQPDSIESINQFVRVMAREMRARPFTTTFMADRLNRAYAELGLIMALTDWAGEHLQDDVGVLEDLSLSLGDLTHSFSTLTEVRRAWWMLHQYQETLRRHTALYGENQVATLRDSLEQARLDTLAASQRVSEAMVALFSQVELEDVVFKLPGEVQVKNIFGRMLYNRETSFLQGCFGGRLEFPQLSSNAFFEITEACLDTDGSYHLAVTNTVPLPFGETRLLAGLDVRGSPAGVASYSGAGTLAISNNWAGERFYDVSLVYDQEAKRLSCDTAARDLSLPFGRDFVLFDAGMGFDVSLDQPAGQFRVLGAAGLIATDRMAPLPEPVGRTNFHLMVTNLATTIGYSNQVYSLSLTNGTLYLPEIFRASELAQCPTNQGQVDLGPLINLKPDRPLAVQIVQSEDPKAYFSGALEFRNIGLDFPLLQNLAVDICQATLIFPTNDIPRFTNLFAQVQIPIPNLTSRVDIVNAEWGVDGYPTGTLRLGTDIPLLDQGNFNLTLLGADPNTCTNGIGFKLRRLADNQPELTLYGGIRLGLDELSVSSLDGSKIYGESCGSVVFSPTNSPAFTMETLAFGGTYRLGGSGGLKINDARIELNNLENLLQQSLSNPFLLKLSGTVLLPQGPGLKLVDAKFTFTGSSSPGFSIAGFELINAPWENALLANLPGGAGGSEDPHTYTPVEGLALQVEAVGIYFLDPDLKLPNLLNPNNMRLTMTAQLQLPPEDPVFLARVDDLQLQLINGDLNVLLSGVGFGFSGLEFPPLELHGFVYVGGLNSSNIFDSPDIYLAGRVGGTVSGAGVVATLALTPKGILGICLDVDAGPGGIPLGPSGFLLTGVGGGVTFTNSTDPCDFTQYISLDNEGKPEDEPGGSGGGFMGSVDVPITGLEAVTWEGLAWQRRRQELDRQLLTAEALSLALQDGSSTDLQPEEGGAGGGDPGSPCVLAPCPPATISLLCQPHPDQALYSNHVILKFTSLDEEQLNSLGITPELVGTLGSTPEEIGQNVSAMIRDNVDARLPRVEPGEVITPELAFEINQGITNILNDIQSTLSGLIRDAVEEAAGTSGSVYQAILQAAYGGVPCPSAVVKVTGTFSHAAVSTFLSGTVGGVLSSDGSAGLIGSLNLVGIPVGKMRAFVAVSDAQGNPNPSLCGQVEAALGPLEMGVLQALYACDGCTDGLANSLTGLAGCLGAEADLIIYMIAADVAPELNLDGLSSVEILSVLAANPAQMSAFLAELMRDPMLPPGMPECFIQMLGAAWDSLQPHISICGEAQPKLFGLPLTSETGSVFLDVTKTNVTALVGLSPTYLIGNTLLCLSSAATICQGIFPAFDEGSMGFALSIPDPGRFLLAGLSGELNSPEALNDYLEESFAYMLQEGSFTISYKLNPFGFEIGNAQARVILPDLTEHPSCVGGYIRPENLGLPSRLDLLLAAMGTNLLGNPAWKGDETTLPWVYPETDPRRDQLAGLSLNRDYFPYGGMAGAMRLQMPKALVDAPPPVLGQIFEDRPVLERLAAAGEYVTGYLLAGSEIGSLAFYLPAPNPPCLPGSPRELLDAISDFDLNNLAIPEFYASGESFMRGYVEGRLLGIPIVQGTLVMMPPDNDYPGRLLGEARIPSNSWLSNFVDGAEVSFEVSQSPPRPVEMAFMDLYTQIINATNSGNQTVMNQLAGGMEEFISTNLPKAHLAMTVTNLRIPPVLTNLLSASGSAEIHAFSPLYNLSETGTGPLAEARRRGGIALQAQLRFGDLVTIDNAELAIYPDEDLPVPALAGLLDAPLITLPSGLQVHDALLEFDTDPGPGQPFLDAYGGIDPIIIRVPPQDIEPLLTIEPLAPGASLLSGHLEVYEKPGGGVSTELILDPARVEMPILGGDVSVLIHGIGTEGPDPSLPFRFSTEGRWDAAVTLTGSICLQDGAGRDVVCFGAATPESVFEASLVGNGLNLLSLSLHLPNNLGLTVFPGTGQEQVFSLGASADLTILGNGRFVLIAELGNTLQLDEFGFGEMAVDASVFVSEDELSISGNLTGGVLTNVNLLSVTGTLRVTRTTLDILGEASVPAFRLGAFNVSGAAGPSSPITALLTNGGFHLQSGAKLRLLPAGYPPQDLFTLRAFSMYANGDLRVIAQSGSLYMPGYLRMTGGTATFIHTNRHAVLDIANPGSLTLFPDKPEWRTSYSPGLTRLLVESDGRFYADTGQKIFKLPAGFTGQGRMEIGYEPDPHEPMLVTPTELIDFGTINYGDSTLDGISVENAGDGLLRVTVLSSRPDVFSAYPSDFVVEPGQSLMLDTRFTPSSIGFTSGTLTLLNNSPGGSTVISVRGTARAVPQGRLSVTQLNFGEVASGRSKVMALRVDNVGLLPLNAWVTSIPSPFSISPTTFNLGPGEHALATVTFAPGYSSSFSGSLKIAANDPTGTHSVGLLGVGYEPSWYLQDQVGQALHTIAMNTSGRGFAAGHRGGLVRTDNQGRAWEDVNLPDATTFYAAAFADDGIHGAVVGAMGRIYLTSNQGRTWSRHTPGIGGDHNNLTWKGVAFVPGTWQQILLGYNEVIRQSVVAVALNNFGTTYEVRLGSDVTPYRLTCGTVAQVGTQVTGLIGTSSGYVARSITAGQSWVTYYVGPGSVESVDLLPSGRALAALSTGRIYQSENMGQTWTLRSSGRGGLTEIRFSGSTTAYAVNEEGEVYRCASSGGAFANWVREESSLGPLYGLATTGGRAWAVGRSARIYHRPGYSLSAGLLVLDPLKLDFGFVPNGQTKARALRLINRGKGPLSITKILPVNAPESDISISTALPLTLQAGQEALMQVFFTPATTRSFDGQLRIYSSDPESPQDIGLRGSSASQGWVLKPFLPNHGGETVRDLQLVSDTVGYAITSSRVYKSTDAGRSWVQITAPTGAPFFTLYFKSTSVGFIGGGATGTSPTTRIWYTSNGGASWISVHQASGMPVIDIDFGTTLKDIWGYAITSGRIGIPREPGKVLRTINSGQTWAARTVPTAHFSVTSLQAVSATEVFLGNSSSLYRSTDSAGTWTEVINNGGSYIRSLDFYGSQFGVAVGYGGTVWRTTIGGDSSAEWYAVTPFTTFNLEDVTLADSANGWMIPSASESVTAIFRTSNSGASWTDELDDSPYAGPADLKPTVVEARNANLAVAMGTGGHVRRYEPYPVEYIGLASVPPVLDFGSLLWGKSSQDSVVLRNIGNASLTVTDASINRLAGNEAGFRLSTTVPFTVSAGGAKTLTIVSSNNVAGESTATLTLTTDGEPQSVAIELRSDILEPPTVVVLDTQPPGLSLRVDGVLWTAPVAFTVKASASGTGEWTRGTVHTIEALSTQSVFGQGYAFVKWTPGGDRVFSHTADYVSETYQATYAVSDLASGGGEVEDPVLPSGGGIPPSGVRTGPYLRFSNGSLSNSVVGSFRLQGAALLSEDLMDVALQSSAFRLPENLSVAPLVEMSAGSWGFLYSNSVTRLQARTPSLSLVGNSVHPPSDISLQFDSLGHFDGAFNLPQGWTVAPGLLEIGPNASIHLAYNGFLSATSSGQVRALRLPGGQDWAYQGNLNLNYSPGPFTNTVPLSGSVMQILVPGTSTEFVELRGGSGSAFEVSRNQSGVFTARLKNALIDVMETYVGSFSATATTDGRFSFGVSSSYDYRIGPFIWDTSGTTYLDWNIKNGSLAVRLPGGTLRRVNSNTPRGWPSAGLTVPAVTIDNQGDFEFQVTLPSGFTFDGMGLGNANEAADRYVLIRRLNGVMALKIRDQREFFGSRMGLGFDINGSGAVSGFFQGSFGVDFPLPLGHFSFADVYLGYDSARAPYQFQGNLRAAGNDFRVQFGSGGGRICHLICDGSSCTETVCLGTD